MANGRSASNARSTALWLGAILVLALVLRIAFNIGVAYDEETENYLYSGNDPWYHDRTVEHILATGESLTTDPVINFPDGARNPNPPVFDWTTAVDAKFLEMAGASDPGGLALNLSVAFWGALTIIPVFMIGKALWGRTAGLWAAFFMAFSAPHIQRTVFGFADHDATTMFFITLGMAFLINALLAMKHKEYVKDWRSDAMAGIRRAAGENKVAILWSALAGTAIAATALTWKGYPYVLAVMAVAFGLQLLVDHARNKDSTVVSFVYLVPMILSLLVAWPYYGALDLGNTTITPHIYVLVGMLLAAIILVPTRDLPSILVFPALAVTAILGLLALLFVVPDVGRTIFTGLGYFEQSKLFTTIAEAQRTEIGFIAANFGFFTFLLAFWAFFRAVGRSWKGEAAMMLMASWSLVAFFMAFAASRFVMNAAPVFVVLAGAATSWILARAGFGEVARRRRQLHGQGSAVGNSFKSLTGRSVTISILVALFLILPNVWIGVDAGTSNEFEEENGFSTSRWGAFGIGFDIKGSGWYDLFGYLSEQDTDLAMEDRPGFIAWWDYGHWATAVGQHPTVADPFQNHYEIAGRFLASESEEESTTWLAILLVDGSRKHGNQDAAFDVLEQWGVETSDYRGNYDQKFAAVSAAVSGDDVHDLYSDLREATGKSIEYLGVDSRMFPISQFNSGIFYAPVFLANKNPDDFLAVTYTGQGVQLELQQYGVDDNGNSFRYAEPRWVDAEGERWVVVGNQAFRGTEAPIGAALGGAQGIAVQPQFQPTERFQNSMYRMAFGSIDPSIAPGDGLKHWKVVYDKLNSAQGQQFRATALLQYFEGHEVSGTVVDDAGAPMGNVQVTFVDEFGAGHDIQSTDADGRFTVLAPPGELQLTIRSGGSDIYSEPWTQDEDGGSTSGVTVTVPRADLEGRTYRDLNGDGAYTEGTDEPVAGASVTVYGTTVTSGADGMYRFEDVRAGSTQVVASKTGFEDAGAFTVLVGGDTVTADIIMAAAPSDVTVTFRDGGQPTAGVPVRFQGPQDELVTTLADGTATVTLEAGSYTVTVDHSFTRDGVEVIYDEEVQITVPFGGEPFAFTIDA